MKKIIFDFDGVLVDSNMFALQIIFSILDEHSVSYDRNDEIQKIMPLPGDLKARYLIDKFGINVSTESLVSSINARCYVGYRDNIPAKESVPETLSELKKQGYCISVLTATPHQAVDVCLKRLGFFDFFDHIWSCDEFGMGKNDPDLFYAVAEKLGVTTDQCILVDDSLSSLKAAKDAGMEVIGAYDPCSSKLNGKIKEFSDGYIYQLRELLPIIGGLKFESVNDYIRFNWDSVVRECREGREQHVGLPYPFTVPAVGYFETLYYWDTYFTNIGLMLDGRQMLAKNNADNILYLIEKLGFMPNSNGTYHLDHSQPPFLSIMVKELYEYYGDKVWLSGAYEMIGREYEFWMTKRITPIGLNRYDTDITDREYLATRAGDYEERIHRKLSGDRASIGRHYLATCESGYDCNSRFEFDIYNYVPVCLNSLLYALEINMGYFAKELDKSENEQNVWIARSEARKTKMKKYMLDKNGCFRDYNYVTGKLSNDFSCASVFPLYVGLADQQNATDFMARFDRLEEKYGVLANEKNDFEGSYQWGYPNGWAPHQIMVIEAFDRYGHKKDAMRIARKYLTLVDRVFAKTQKLWEKYNVVDGNCDVEDEAQGGMPPMMGWTAGAYLYAQSYVNKERDRSL